MHIEPPAGVAVQRVSGGVGRDEGGVGSVVTYVCKAVRLVQWALGRITCSSLGSSSARPCSQWQLAARAQGRRYGPLHV